MGWFSADEIVAIGGDANDTIKTVSLAAIALLALAYGLFRLCAIHHRHQSEQVAQRVVRLQV